MKLPMLCSFLLMSAVTQAGVNQAWTELAANRFEEARAMFAAEDDVLARIGWFLTFTGDGPTPAMEEAALTILREDPTSGAAEFVLKWMDSYNDCIGDWGDKVGTLLAENPATNPEIRVYAANNLRLFSRQKTEPPAFEQIAVNAGFLTDFKVSERFGAYPIPAFETPWPADKAAFWEKATDHHTRTGVMMPPRNAQGRGVYYALAAFENPVEQDVILRFFSYQNAALYVDGKRWGEFKRLETLGPSITFLQGRLGPGHHEVVIKTTQTANNNGQFSVQVSAPEAVRFLKPGGARFDLGEPRADVTPVDVGLLKEIEGRDGPLADLVRAFLYLRTKSSQRALALLEPLAVSYGNSKIIGGSVARVYISVLDFLPQDAQLSRAYQYLSKLAMEGAENNLENLLTLALLLNKAQQKKPALELINGVIEANTGFCDALEARLLFARQDGLSDVYRQTLDLVEDLGRDHRWAQVKLLGEARREGDLERTRELLVNLSRLLPWEGYRAQLDEMDEDYEAAIADFTKRWEVFDDRDFYPFAISQSHAKLGDRKAQREWLERTLAINPGKREAILDLVNLDCFEGKIEDARARLQQYLQLEPADAFFRQRLSHLEGRTAFEAFRVDTARVIEDAKNKPISKGADSELLLDQLMVRLFPDGSQMRYTHLVTRVLTKKGVDEESELSLGDNLEILELRTIKKDGSVFYPADIEHKSTISLSGIGVGDFIDEEHIEYIGPAYYDQDGLDAEMTFIFQGVDRIYHHSELVLIYPADLEPAPVLQSSNMPVEPEVMERGDLKIVRWLTKDMPPMVEEPGMPFRAYSQPTATFYYNTSWDEIRAFYYHAVRDRMGLSDRVKSQITRWKDQHNDPLELARFVYEEVTSRTERGNTFFSNVNLVWENRQGNPTLLLANMYEDLGYDVQVVFAQPEEMRHYGLDVPQPVYTYAVLRLTIDGQVYWADPSQKSVAFNYIPFIYRGGRGMVMDLDGPLFVELPSGDDRQDRTVSKYNLYFRADGSVAGLSSDTYYGLTAGELAEGYTTLNAPEIKQRVEAGVNQDYPGSVVSEVTVVEDSPRGEFEIQAQFSHKGLATVTGDTLSLSFPLNKTPLLEVYGSLPSRKTPVAVRAPRHEESELTLMVPEGFIWEEKLVDVHEESPFGSYELKLNAKSERELTLKRVYRLKPQFVQPEDYPSFQAFLRLMVEHEGFSLTATKKE